MGKMVGQTVDVVAFIKSQHEQIKTLFEDVHATSGKEREQAFFQLRKLLAVHETAEEEIIHPAARKALPDGEQIVEARLHEEREAKLALADLETLDVDSPEFMAKLIDFRASVLAHAEAEEQDELGRLGSELPQERLQGMGKAAALAEAVAPTRPHPGVESQAANLIVGPFASMLDRARDAIAGKS